MHFKPAIDYPEDEKPKLDLLENLFRAWHQHFANNGSTLGKHSADDMVSDGFYPHYWRQIKRILFIGWESVDIDGCNYIDILHPCYRTTKLIGGAGGRHLNQSSFHYRMICIAYGILNGMPRWQDIPHASNIGDTFGEPNGLSFAFMNISKLSNVRWQANHGVINAAYSLSVRPRNFIQEEVTLLKPHVVITMNLGDKIASLGQLTLIHSSAQAESYWLDCSAHRSLLINTWHFSARKPHIEGFYAPICDAIRHSESVSAVEQAVQTNFEENETLNPTNIKP